MTSKKINGVSFQAITHFWLIPCTHSVQLSLFQIENTHSGKQEVIIKVKKMVNFNRSEHAKVGVVFSRIKNC